MPRLPPELEEDILTRFFWTLVTTRLPWAVPPTCDAGLDPSTWEARPSRTLLDHLMLIRGTDKAPAASSVEIIRRVCPAWAAVCDELEQKVIHGSKDELRPVNAERLRRVQILDRVNLDVATEPNALKAAGLFHSLRALNVQEFTPVCTKMLKNLPRGPAQLEEMSSWDSTELLAFLPLCTRLQRLEVWKVYFSLSSLEHVKVIGQLGNLEELTLGGSFFRAGGDYMAEDALRSVLAGSTWRAPIRKVALLETADRAGLSPLLAWHLIQLFKDTLREADIVNVARSAMRPQTPSSSFPLLRRLRLSTYAGLWNDQLYEGDHHPFIQLLQEAPNLQDLALRQVVRATHSVHAWTTLSRTLCDKKTTLRSLAFESVRLNFPGYAGDQAKEEEAATALEAEMRAAGVAWRWERR